MSKATAYICPNCGEQSLYASDDVTLYWDIDAQQWEISDDGYPGSNGNLYCGNCDHICEADKAKQEVEYDLPAKPEMTINEAWKICKDKPGTFGNLYDPEEIMTIMDGWASAEERDDPDGQYFDPKNAEHMAAMLAWCEEHGPGFEDDMSNNVCSNLPTRNEAYAALDKKRKAESEAA